MNATEVLHFKMIYLEKFRCVVRMVMKRTKCPTCVNSLEADLSQGCVPKIYSLIAHKSNGGLLFPSTSVLRLCKEVETHFSLLEKGDSFMNPQHNFLVKHITLPVVTKIVETAP